jgi:hypothetical protein
MQAQRWAPASCKRLAAQQQVDGWTLLLYCSTRPTAEPTYIMMALSPLRYGAALWSSYTDLSCSASLRTLSTVHLKQHMCISAGQTVKHGCLTMSDQV